LEPSNLAWSTWNFLVPQVPGQTSEHVHAGGGPYLTCHVAGAIPQNTIIVGHNTRRMSRTSAPMKANCYRDFFTCFFSKNTSNWIFCAYLSATLLCPAYVLDGHYCRCRITLINGHAYDDRRHAVSNMCYQLLVGVLSVNRGAGSHRASVDK
jgi:hypothetical protein